MALLGINPKFFSVDTNGDQLKGYKVYTYKANSTTLKTTYTDSTAGTPNANPVILDSTTGLADIWLAEDEPYRIVITDTNDHIIDSVDNVAHIADINSTGATIKGLTLNDDLDVNDNSIVTTSNGSIFITPDGFGRTKITDIQSISDFDTNGQNILFDDGTSIKDDSGNEYIKFSKTSSAVNYIGIGNAATGNDVTISTSGTDDNVGLQITPKGTGVITLDGLALPNTISSGSNLDAIATNGSGTLSFTNVTPSELRAYIDGFITSLSTLDDANDIVINPGFCRDNSNTVNITLSSAITKQLDADWAEGSNAGGYGPSAVLAADTFLHVFVISKADGTVDAGFDSDINASNLLAAANDDNYQYYRRVGTIKTYDNSGSVEITPYTQVANYFFWHDPPDFDDVNSVEWDADLSSALPPDVSVQVILQIHSDLVGGNAYLNHTGVTSEVNSISAAPLANVVADSGGAYGNPVIVPTNTSGKIFLDATWTTGLTSEDVSQIGVLGWIDYRGEQNNSL